MTEFIVKTRSAIIWEITKQAATMTPRLSSVVLMTVHFAKIMNWARLVQCTVIFSWLRHLMILLMTLTFNKVLDVSCLILYNTEKSCVQNQTYFSRLQITSGNIEGGMSVLVQCECVSQGINERLLISLEKLFMIAFLLLSIVYRRFSTKSKIKSIPDRNDCSPNEDLTLTLSKSYMPGNVALQTYLFRILTLHTRKLQNASRLSQFPQ